MEEKRACSMNLCSAGREREGWLAGDGLEREGDVGPGPGRWLTDHGVEGFFRDEVVLFAIRLTGSRGTRSIFSSVSSAICLFVKMQGS